MLSVWNPRIIWLSLLWPSLFLLGFPQSVHRPLGAADPLLRKESTLYEEEYRAASQQLVLHAASQKVSQLREPLLPPKK